MGESTWARCSPGPVGEVSAVWTAEPASVAELSHCREELRGVLFGRSRAPGADSDDTDRLLLLFEELASNGLRHGRPPVRAIVVTVASGWLIEVSDAAADALPEPAVGRDAAEGGLGLFLVARLSAAHGWAVRDGRKHVWARIDVV